MRSGGIYGFGGMQLKIEMNPKQTYTLEQLILNFTFCFLATRREDYYTNSRSVSFFLPV
jgi:hypothetical protein